MQLITEQELKEWTGYERTADLEKWCIDNRIPYYRGKGGRICVTIEAINRHKASNDDFDNIEFFAS